MYYKLRSNAKINLHLKVLYKRKDGYHQIESLIFPISYSDNIIVTEKNKIAKSIEDIKISSFNYIGIESRELFESVSERGNIKNNLVYKLFEKIFEYKIEIPQYKVIIYKKIPPGSGVGGGSSNVGTLLRFLISQKILSQNIALKIAESLGSDIPFFIYNHPCYVSGRGEVIELIPEGYSNFFKNLYGIILFNAIGISTKFAYEALKKPLQEEYKKIYGNLRIHQGREFIEKFLPRETLKGFLKNCKNDFEVVIFDLYKDLLDEKNLMEKTNPLKVMLTGSGSAIFSLYDDKYKMLEAYKYLKKFENTKRIFKPFKFYTGQSPSGKASDFGSDIRRFESSLPSHFFL